MFFFFSTLDFRQVNYDIVSFIEVSSSLCNFFFPQSNIIKESFRTATSTLYPYDVFFMYEETRINLGL